MKIRCKLCGKLLESEESSEGIPFSIVAGDESSFKLAEMGNNLLVLMSHLLTEHPNEALEIYSNLNSKLSSIFEIIRDEDFQGF